MRPTLWDRPDHSTGRAQSLSARPSSARSVTVRSATRRATARSASSPNALPTSPTSASVSVEGAASSPHPPSRAGLVVLRLLFDFRFVEVVREVDVLVRPVLRDVAQFW